MEETPAERIARKSNRPMPSIPTFSIAREGAPALEIGKRRAKDRHSVERPRNLSTPITPRHFELIDDITRHYKAIHGRSAWKMNLTVELAIEDLARKLGLLK